MQECEKFAVSFVNLLRVFTTFLNIDIEDVTLDLEPFYRDIIRHRYAAARAKVSVLDNDLLTLSNNSSSSTMRRITTNTRHFVRLVFEDVLTRINTLCDAPCRYFVHMPRAEAQMPNSGIVSTIFSANVRPLTTSSSESDSDGDDLPSGRWYIDSSESTQIQVALDRSIREYNSDVRTVVDESPPDYPMDEDPPRYDPLLANFERYAAELTNYIFFVLEFRYNMPGVVPFDAYDFADIIATLSEIKDLINRGREMSLIDTKFREIFARAVWFGKKRTLNYFKLFFKNANFMDYDFHRNCPSCFARMPHCAHQRPGEIKHECMDEEKCMRASSFRFVRNSTHNYQFLFYYMIMKKQFTDMEIWNHIFCGPFGQLSWMTESLKKHFMLLAYYPGDASMIHYSGYCEPVSLALPYEKSFVESNFHFLKDHFNVTSEWVLKAICMALAGQLRLARVYATFPAFREIIYEGEEVSVGHVPGITFESPFLSRLFTTIFEKFRMGHGFFISALWKEVIHVWTISREVEEEVDVEIKAFIEANPDISRFPAPSESSLQNYNSPTFDPIAPRHPLSPVSPEERSRWTQNREAFNHARHSYAELMGQFSRFEI